MSEQLGGPHELCCFLFHRAAPGPGDGVLHRQGVLLFGGWLGPGHGLLGGKQSAVAGCVTTRACGRESRDPGG